MSKWWKNIGPATLIAAAFIGPGTVTLCTIAGVQFGLALLWAMIFSIIATLVLQEMSARLGIITGKGLATVIRESISSPILRWGAILLVLSAIVVGNLFYEAGNISGGVLGMELLFGAANLELLGYSINLWSWCAGGLAFVLLYLGNYRLIERSLVALVVLMSATFVVTALMTQPDLGLLFGGLFVPRINEENILTVIGLVGTTVVPYNLFLHADLVRERWKSADDLPKARQDTFVSIILGGLVSMCIIIAAAAVTGAEISSAADLGRSLQPLLGDFAPYFIGLGLFAAGLTSAITAPLAAAYVAAGCLGWSKDLKNSRFRVVWMIILILGVLFSSLGIEPIEIIRFAQAANGLLLPIVAGFLLWVTSRGTVMGAARNRPLLLGLGFIILAFTIFLGVKGILKVF